MSRLVGSRSLQAQRASARSVDLRAIAQAVRATGNSIKALVAASDASDSVTSLEGQVAEIAGNLAKALDMIQATLSETEHRVRNLSQPLQGNQPTQPLPIMVSADHILGGIEVTGGQVNNQGQGLDLTFTTNMGMVLAIDHQNSVYLPLTIDGLPVTINGGSKATTTVGAGFGLALTAFGSLPAAGSTNKGQLWCVTDSNTNVWGATIAGGGANIVLAFSDGTNWTVAGK